MLFFFDAARATHNKVVPTALELGIPRNTVNLLMLVYLRRQYLIRKEKTKKCPRERVLKHLQRRYKFIA